MSRKSLEEASDLLYQASDAASGERAKRLADQAEAFADMATADRGPDHGRLARHENKFHDLTDDVDPTVAELIDDAFDAVHNYRESVDGV